MALFSELKKTLLLNIDDSLSIAIRSLSFGAKFGEWLEDKKEGLEGLVSDAMQAEIDVLAGALDDELDDDIDSPVDPIADEIDDGLDSDFTMEDALADPVWVASFFEVLDNGREKTGLPPLTYVQKQTYLRTLHAGGLTEDVAPWQHEVAKKLSRPRTTGEFGPSPLSIPQWLRPQPEPEGTVHAFPKTSDRVLPVAFVDKTNCPVIALHGKKDAIGDAVKIHINTDDLPRLSDLQIDGIAVHIHEFEQRFRTTRLSDDPIEVNERVGANAIPLFGRNLSLNGADSMLVAADNHGWSPLAAYVAHGEGPIKNAGLRGYPIVTRPEFENSQITMDLALGPLGIDYRDRPVYVTVSLLMRALEEGAARAV